MVSIIITILVAFPVFLLWFAFLSLTLRPFGLRMPLSPFEYRERKSVLQSLTFSQYLAIYGVLYFGCGMVIMTTLSRYLDWKYFHGSSSSLTEPELLRNVFEWILGGVAFGLLSFSQVHRSARNDDAQALTLLDSCNQAMLGIPVKVNGDSTGKPNGVPLKANSRRSEATLA